MNKLDDLNMISKNTTKKLKKVSNNVEALNRMSDDFSEREPNATLEFTRLIRNDIQAITVDRQSDVKAMEDILWKYFLIGYEAGKETHKTNLGGL